MTSARRKTNQWAIRPSHATIVLQMPETPFPQSSLGTNKEATQSPHNHRLLDEKARSDILPAMPPPSVPSQTPSAQELRETAKLTINRPDKVEPPRTSGGSAAPSPRPRSPSPSSRPGTRDASTESRASGGRSRSDREPDRDDRRSREHRQEPHDISTLNRRDSLTHNRTERSGRERLLGDKEVDRDKDRDRGRDRHGDREKERDREPVLFHS